MFDAVLDPRLKYVWISAPTRYGKSEIVAMAAIYLAAIEKLNIRIIGLTKNKAKKVMQYVLEHLADNVAFYEKLINKEIIKDIEKLRLKVTKQELVWADNGGSIEILGTKSTGGDILAGLTGEGADVVIVEEAGLIRRDDTETQDMIVRMAEPYSRYGKLVLVGNLIEGSWFEKAYKDKDYYKVFITLAKAKQDIPEWTDEYLASKKRKMSLLMWKRMFEMEWVSSKEFEYFKPQTYKILPPLKELELYGGLDPALGENKKGSMTAIVVLGRHKETRQWYEVENVVEKLTPGKTIDVVVGLARKYKFERFFVESVAFQSYFKDKLVEAVRKADAFLPVIGVKPKEAKQVRIESLEPVVRSGEILFSGMGGLWDELKFYPEVEHVDGLDAVAMVWNEVMGESFYVV